MDTIQKKNPNYVRCIKPNNNKLPANCDNDLILNQCKYLGLSENIKVKRAGYIYRQRLDKFLQRYKSLNQKTWPNWEGDVKEGIIIILKDIL